MARLLTVGGRRRVTVTEETSRSRTVRESAARTYAHALPIVPVRARGLTIEGADGRRYLDCLSGAGTLALGHNHPVVLEAIRTVLDSGAPLHVPDLSTPVEDAFVTELLRTLPPDLAAHARVRFCGPSRTSALEGARRLVRSATGGTEVITLSPTRTEGGSPAAAGSPPDLGLVEGEGESRAEAVEVAGCSPQPVNVWPESVHPAGVIVEAVRNDDRVGPTPDSWMREVRRLTADRTVPLIADETETGVGRTGAFWAVEHSGVTPDVMVLSKAIGGSLPLSLIVHHADLTPDAPVSTVRGNQLAMAAGTATLRHVRENGLAERAAILGRRVLLQLVELSREFPCIGHVRGRGLLTGIEFTPPESDEALAATPAPGPSSAPTRVPLRTTASELAAGVQRECLQRGLIVGLGGTDSNVVRLLPPLTISDEQADAVIDRLSEAVAAAARGHRAG
ncbi:aminotransferase class III-fold pyridoxal phosphate-dependent enzyme [Streptomyces sp. SAI-170]|uniref:aminotransferase class III-fold pyridoxal phosphate-dependent enzyme n=1 Tax=Streptomyces sp. SAI-170 TaxID=3377729 RepID=UPI003C7DBEE2